MPFDLFCCYFFTQSIIVKLCVKRTTINSYASRGYYVFKCLIGCRTAIPHIFNGHWQAPHCLPAVGAPYLALLSRLWSAAYRRRRVPGQVSLTVSPAQVVPTGSGRQSCRIVFLASARSWLDTILGCPKPATGHFLFVTFSSSPKLFLRTRLPPSSTKPHLYQLNSSG